MKSIHFVLLAAAVAVFMEAGAAQVPHTISYQGYYTKNGQPVTNTYPMTFRLWTQQVNGILTWSQSFGSVPIIKGVYSVVLNVDSVVFDRQYWLETEINNVTSANRTQLTGVPYSLAPWMPSDSNVYFSSGNVGIGTNTPRHRLSIAGGPFWTSNFWKGAAELENGAAIAWPANGAGQRFGMGHTNGGLLMFRTASDPGSTASPTSYDFVISDAGNVGIGTTNPLARLHVAGTGYFSGNVGFGTQSPDHQLTVSGAYTGQGGTGSFINFKAENPVICCPAPTELLVGADIDGGIISTKSADDLMLGAAGNYPRMVIKPSGKIGVGTATPTEKFEVSGGSINVVSSGAPDNGGDGLRLGSVDGAYRWLQSFGDQPLAINPLGNNVGIGTTNPGAPLEVIGRTRTGSLEITGGSDLAEPFETADDEKLEAGTVMVIDPDHPGKLRTSEHAFDRRVAGIVSGAGGVKPGLTMRQIGVMEGNSLIAIAGRVYCKAAALSVPIEPGDLLTTSNIPGHAMKAADRGRSRGAVIGKAMTGLKEGKGLILVLVNLQ